MCDRAGVAQRVFTHSYLGLGMDSAMHKAADLVLQVRVEQGFGLTRRLSRTLSVLRSTPCLGEPLRRRFSRSDVQAHQQRWQQRRRTRKAAAAASSGGGGGDGGAGAAADGEAERRAAPASQQARRRHLADGGGGAGQAADDEDGEEGVAWDPCLPSGCAPPCLSADPRQLVRTRLNLPEQALNGSRKTLTRKP